MDDMMILVVYSPGTGPCFVFFGAQIWHTGITGGGFTRPS